VNAGSDRPWPDAEPETDPVGFLAVPAPPSRAGTAAVLVPLVVGGLVAIALGIYGRLHEPTFVAVNVAGFSSGVAAKSWLATVAFVLALVQLWSAAVMYGRIGPRPAPRWIGGLHRWSGRIAVLVTVPVVVHCLYALGFQDGTARLLLHSVLGCFFYGAFVAKMLLLTRSGTPRWSLPVLGGAVFAGLTGIWLTSALWFFTTTGITF
jgi:hypothetical protein